MFRLLFMAHELKVLFVSKGYSTDKYKKCTLSSAFFCRALQSKKNLVFFWKNTIQHNIKGVRVMTKLLHHGVHFWEWNLSHSRFKGQVAMVISIYRVSVCSIYKRRGKSLFYCKKWPQDVALSLRNCIFKLLWYSNQT